MELIIVTGLSGAGKSTVSAALEDIGYFCVDNLPLRLIPVLVSSVIEEGTRDKLAVVTDIRAGINREDTEKILSDLKSLDVKYKILFIDCKSDVILSRFKLARRAHPLMKECSDNLVFAIEKEKELLKFIKDKADFIIDTTAMSFNSCKNRVFDFFSENDGALSSVKIHCMSFGFKHGIPEDADYIFDVRSLPNPYYVDELKNLTGLDERVSSFVMNFEEAIKYEKKLKDFIDFVVPLCVKDGRSQLIIAIGCTGGHHRSVTFAQLVYSHLIEQGHKVSLNHRDINK
ncbi:MAG: RNase adapter RapZ [Acutalibacteraceae bacterium]